MPKRYQVQVTVEVIADDEDHANSIIENLTDAFDHDAHVAKYTASDPDLLEDFDEDEEEE